MDTNERRLGNGEQTDMSDDNSATLKKTLLLGFTPLVIAIVLYISLSACIHVSRFYANWKLKKQLEIVRCSEQCLIVSNPSIDDSDQQSTPEVV
ncbi:unnamed protein product [Adineta ricciae]|uniref:Uncharacterized protein n=1 Tax=Adineta ricciae TaxID=249248 RepID=A0A814YBV3_ADIRI|nr:unnamed protein product [Adineta ricciae]CAF1227183.1 unnamed protein product [Adineta ricciae]